VNKPITISNAQNSSAKMVSDKETLLPNHIKFINFVLI
jgi:hypothetical protein